MQPEPIDLSVCDTEPIHIPGKIQSHGFLIAVNSETLIITHISENVYDFIKEDGKAFLGKKIEALEVKLDLSGSPLRITQILKLGSKNKSFEAVNPFYVEIAKKPFNLIISISGPSHLLEFEPQTSELELDLHKTIGRSVSEILSDKNLNVLLQNAAREIRHIIHYDRVMIYKFGEDGHGVVVAEVAANKLDPYLGLHFPASDIPKQARELYKINLTRIIADVNSQSAAIITNRPEGSPLDLTHSALRAVSPIHIQYLKNMGVVSSFSISLISKGDLWGLVACHNYSPRFINYNARNASKLIGQILSSALEYREEEESTGKDAELNLSVIELFSLIDSKEDIIDALTGNTITVKDITSSTGAVVVLNNRIVRVGDTPDEEQILEIIGWLKSQMQDGVYHTHRLPEFLMQAAPYGRIASGLLACTLSKEFSEYIIWFKPEIIKERMWAGNPDKPHEINETGHLPISPRRSFATWSQIVKNNSEKWRGQEITNVVKLREKVIHAINKKATAIRLLNDRLKLAYEELDTFSFTISHDLRTPLASIRSYSELLATTTGHLDNDGKQILDRIMACADKMNFLISEILNYSRIGRAEIEMKPLDMTRMLNEIKTEVINALKADTLHFTIGETPSIRGEPTMIYQVFTNLINNAIKYSSRSTPSRVRVDGLYRENEILYSVADNGVGIDVKHYDRVFELFKRMDNAKDFEGTGVGLAIVKRIVEKHDARIWFESTLGEGTVFYILFRNH